MTVVWQLLICVTPVAGVVYVVRMGEEVARFAAQRTADTAQAEHFRQVLDSRKCELRKLLEAELDKVASAFRAGNMDRIRRHRRIVKVLEAELRTVERGRPLLAEQALADRPPYGGDAPPRADHMFGGLLADPWIRVRVAPWMFGTRAQPWYLTRPAAIASAGAAATVRWIRIRVARWMFSMRARPWYLTRPAAIAFAGGAATIVILGVLLALRTPTTAVEKPTTVATTAPTHATPPAASSEPTTSRIPPSPPIAMVTAPMNHHSPPPPASGAPTDPQPAIADQGPPAEPPPDAPTDP
jgi:hypothetical protein